MDADNRVVINCGGIRHEVYKASCRFEIILPPSQVFQQKCEMFWFLRPSVNESSYNCNHLSVSLATKSVLLCWNFKTFSE